MVATERQNSCVLKDVISLCSVYTTYSMPCFADNNHYFSTEVENYGV